MTATTDQKIVLITGANKGIGFAAARELARAGHTVLLGARDPGRGAAAAAELTGQGLDARFVRLDVTDPATIAAAAELIGAEHGRLDILINNAGISRDRPHPPDELPVAVLREIYETNNHTGHLSADEGGAHIARQITLPGDGPTGVFLSEDGGTCPW